MKQRLITTLIVIIFSMGCKEEFSVGTQTEAFFHVRINKAELPVMVRGNTASGKIILFVNGGPGLTSIDAAEANLLNFGNIEKEFAMAYYDQRGTGNSQGQFNRNTLTMDQYVKDLDAIINVLKAKYPDASVFLMNHSFGGMISAFYLLTENHQSEVNGWINIDGSVVVDSKIEWGYRRDFLINLSLEKIALGIDTAHWQNALDWCNNNPVIETQAQKDQWRNFIGHPGEGVLPSEDQELKTRDAFRIIFLSSYNIFPAYLSQNLKITGDALYQDVKGTNLLPVLDQVTLPSLFIWGRYDDLIPPELGSDAFDQLGTGAGDRYFKLLEASGHQPMITEPQVLNQSVVDFVRTY